MIGALIGVPGRIVDGVLNLLTLKYHPIKNYDFN